MKQLSFPVELLIISRSYQIYSSHFLLILGGLPFRSRSV